MEPVRTRRNRPAVAATLAGLVIFTLAGCSSSTSKPTAHLSGTVTIQGQPIPADATGTIMFRPAEKGMAKTAGVPVVDGKYDSPETPIGKVTVFFSIHEPTGKMISDAGGPEFPEMESIVPQKSTNGIELVISGDDPQQDFDLE